MLYQMHEFSRALMAPLAQWAQLGARMLSDDSSPLAHTPFSQKLSAGYELFFRLLKEYEKPAFDIQTVESAGHEYAIVEQAVEVRPFCRLLHFQKQAASDSPDSNHAIPYQPKVLLVAPLSGHYATLLRDTVRALLTDHDVYITDWADARTVPLQEGAFHLDDYVRYIQDFLHLLGPEVHVIAVCQPVAPVLAAISLMASANDPVQPRSMIMMGGPVDARCSPTEVNNLATQKPYSWFENSMICEVPAGYPGAGRKVYPGFLQHVGFVAMNPRKHAQSHWDFYLHLRQGDNESADAHRKFYDEYNALLDMPAEYYLDTIRIVFQDADLPEGRWEIDGKLVRPQDIKSVALMTVEGELDDISGLGQTRAALDLCSGIAQQNKKHFCATGCGHYGIFSGRRWRETICPEIAAFIRQHDQPPASITATPRRKTKKA